MDYSKYTNPIEYPKKPTQPSIPKNDNTEFYSTKLRQYADEFDTYNKLLEKYKADKAEYDKYANWKQQEFRLDAIEEVGLTGHPLAERAYNYAWEEGHYAGFSEVFSKLTRVAEMILGDSNYAPSPINPMRDRILAYIEQIKHDQGGFSKSNMRWKNIVYAGTHVSVLNFTDLTDAELLSVFESIIRRVYVQM